MKGWILIIFFLVIMLVSSVLEHIYIVNSFETLGEKIIALEQVVNENASNLNVDIVKNEVNAVSEYWKTHEKRLCYFINHQHMEEANRELSKIKVSVEFNDLEEVKKSILLILNFVNGYRDYAVISWESIF